MMGIPRIVTAVLPGFILRYADMLRFPQLFLIFALLFCVDCLIPDPIPLIDEAMLGLVTLLFAKLKKRKDPVKVDPTHG